jgi:2-acylglycerol O-acyltransferase 2
MISAPDAGGLYMSGLAASAALWCPLIGHALGWVGCVHATRDVATSVLRSSGSGGSRHGVGGATPRDRGSLGLNPGGIAEIFFANRSTEETVYLRRRKGFVRLAMQHGATLVPGYCFGNTAALHVLQDRAGVCARVSRVLRVSLLVIVGRWGLPIPFRVPIAGIMGEPIPLKANPNPTDEVCTLL